eukprot:1068620-Lingulodinium_polyedra.AAC.1
MDAKGLGRRCRGRGAAVPRGPSCVSPEGVGAVGSPEGAGQSVSPEGVGEADPATAFHVVASEACRLPLAEG